MILGRMVGCLETIGIAVFALILGAFGASTLMRHLDERQRVEPEPGAQDTVPPVTRSRIRVEVLNGAGLPGAAERVTELLRRRGFDVVDFGNAERFDHPRTRVLDRVGNPEHAREVAAALQGVPIESVPDSSLYLDVTVIIGRDLEDLLGRAERRSGEGVGWRRRIGRSLDWVRERIPWP